MFCRGGAAIRIKDVPDGTSNTILLGEILPEFCRVPALHYLRLGRSNDISQGQTIQPINWPIDPIPLPGPPVMPPIACGPRPRLSERPRRTACGTGTSPGASNPATPGGANFAFADGSVHFLSETIDKQVYQYLGCRHDSQVVTLP